MLLSLILIRILLVLDFCPRYQYIRQQQNQKEDNQSPVIVHKADQLREKQYTDRIVQFDKGNGVCDAATRQIGTLGIKRDLRKGEICHRRHRQ
jgi:hypothetical protein